MPTNLLARLWTIIASVLTLGLAIVANSSAFAQTRDLPTVALPAGGLSVEPGSPLRLSELDVTIGANRAIFRYSITNPLEAEVTQTLRFRFPRLYHDQVAQDPRLRDLRRLNFLDARVRREGERVQISSERNVYYGDLNVTPKTAQQVGGRTLLDVLNNLPLDQLVAASVEALPGPERSRLGASVEQPLDRGKLGIGLSFLWEESIAPGETRQIVLTYRPYASFFRFSDLTTRAFTRRGLDTWQNAINQGFCLNYPENSNLASAFQEALGSAGSDSLSRTWAQSSVVDMGDHSGWAGTIDQLFITIDPNLYDETGRSLQSVASFAAFCGRQGEGLDPDGIIRLSRRGAAIEQVLPILFLHAPSKENERDLASGLIVQNLADAGECAPSNGFLIPCSDMRELAESEVQPLTIEALMRAQLEIYARRGSYFADPRNQAFFEQFGWYEPFTKDPPLSDIEQRNARLIERIRIAKILGDGGGDSERNFQPVVNTSPGSEGQSGSAAQADTAPE